MSQNVDEGHQPAGDVGSGRRGWAGRMVSLAVPVLLGIGLFTLEQRNTRLQAALRTPEPGAERKEPPYPLVMGTKMPRLALRDASGRPRTSVGTPGQPLMLVFLTAQRPLCTTAREQLVPTHRLLARYAQMGLKAAFITDVPPSRLRNTAEKYGITIPIFSDEGGRTAGMFRAWQGFQMFIINPQGEIAFQQGMPVQAENSALTRYLDWLAAHTGRRGRKA